MIEREIPASAEKLPVIGIGSWIQFDVAPDSTDKESLKEVLQLLHKGGGRLIDTSPMYGKAEAVIGELTSALPFADEFFYATKVWTGGRHNGIAQMENSFRLMRRNSIDLVQVHNLQDWQTHLETLNAWKQEGKVRYTGITHYRDSAHAEMERIVKTGSVDFAQFNYSILSRNAERTLLTTCRDHGVAVIVNEPLDKGRLFERVHGVKLPSWAKEIDVHNWAAFFLKYILAEDAVTCVIPGTSNADHLRDILQAAEGVMPDEKMRARMRAFIEM